MKLFLSWKVELKGEAVFWIVSMVFILTGAMFLYGVPKLLNLNIEQCTQKTTGKVIDLVQAEKDYYYPVYEFKDEKGKIIRKESDSGSNIPAYKTGDAVEVFYNPANPQEFFVSGENDELLIAFKIIGLVFLALGIIILSLTLPSIIIKIYSPQNTDCWFWWVNFIGGMSGALIFSLPSTFIWMLYMVLPENIKSAFAGKFFLLWIFTAVGILVNVGIFFIARSQLRGRPVWKSLKN